MASQNMGNFFLGHPVYSHEERQVHTCILIIRVFDNKAIGSSPQKDDYDLRILEDNLESA